MKTFKNFSSLIIIFIVYLGWTVSIKAQTSIFWEISGNGLEKPSYLFGTLHIIPQSDLFMPDELEEKFKSSQQIVLEVDMDATDFMIKTQQLMFMPENKRIRDLLTADEYTTIEKFFKDSLNLSLEQFQRLKPLFLVQFILPKIINRPIASYELNFLQMAQKNQIELTGLETIEEQMNSLDKISFQKQSELVLETIKSFTESRTLYKELIEAYKKMDLKNIHTLMFEASKELEEFEQLLLIERNKKWAAKIENLIKAKSCFIAVGALHLEGEYGLVSLLKSKGYNLHPIR